MTPKPKKTANDFATMFEELENLSDSFEHGKFSVEEGIEKFERGLMLAEQLKKRLDAVEQKVEVLKKRFATLQPKSAAIGEGSEESEE